MCGVGGGNFVKSQKYYSHMKMVIMTMKHYYMKAQTNYYKLLLKDQNYIVMILKMCLTF